MKKMALVVIVIIMLFPVIGTAETTSQDFTFGNGIKFGMTMDQIIQIVGDPDDDDATMLVYYDNKTAGKNSSVAYIFDLNILRSIYILFTDSHTNLNDYIDDFNDIDDALRIKYNEPSVDQFYHWKDSLFKDDTEQYGLAISAGQLIILSTWKFQGIEIDHTITGDNYTITHGILYRPQDYEEETNTTGL